MRCCAQAETASSRRRSARRPPNATGLPKWAGIAAIATFVTLAADEPAGNMPPKDVARTSPIANANFMEGTP
jgi:hypothetical protein